MGAQGSEKENILIVDDLEANRFALRDIVLEMGYKPLLAEDGEQALRVLERQQVRVIILDVSMPKIDGYQVCELIKADPTTRDVPVLFISALDDPTSMARGFEVGGADFITKPFVPELVRARINLHVKLYQGTQEVTELNRKLQIVMAEQLRRVEEGKRNVLYALLRMAQENASYDENHMERLSYNSRMLAEAMQLSLDFGDEISNQFIDAVEIAAPICDLGNVAIPTDILSKKGELTAEENEIMRRHTLIGEQIIKDIDDGTSNLFISISRDIAKSHHEQWDGMGYPEGLKGRQIPLAAQIVHMAGVYCALTETRSYRQAFSVEEALDIMKEQSGTNYNPVLFDILYRIRRQLR